VAVHSIIKVSEFRFLDVMTGRIFNGTGKCRIYRQVKLQNFNPSEVLIKKIIKARLWKTFGKITIVLFED
jgi:hypothetical protein